jgi:hypothetical protein
MKDILFSERGYNGMRYEKRLDKQEKIRNKTVS